MSIETVDRVPIQLRVTGETRDAIDQKAREMGISRSMYIRAQVLASLGLPAEPHRVNRVRDDR